MEYLFGQRGQEADVLDFANYVFSQAHRPHDFKQMWPKVYTRDDFAPLHALAMEEGRIRGMAALLPQQLLVSPGLTLSCGYIGTVSVHPYARGQGIMKNLMDMLFQRAQEQDMDLLLLGGRRHRYNYFGFERAGSEITFTFNQDCLHHAMKDVPKQDIAFLPLQDAAPERIDMAYGRYKDMRMVVDRKREEFLAVLSGASQAPWLVIREGKAIGYINVAAQGAISEMGLSLDSMLPVIKAWLIAKGDIKAVVPQHAVEVIELLHPYAENYDLGDSAMARVLNWPRVLSALMQFKHSWMPLLDYQVVLEIAGVGRYLLKVAKGQVSVAPCELSPDITLTHNQAVNLLFSPLSLYKKEKEAFANWLPLPLDIPLSDWF